MVAFAFVIAVIALERLTACLNWTQTITKLTLCNARWMYLDCGTGKEKLPELNVSVTVYMF